MQHPSRCSSSGRWRRFLDGANLGHITYRVRRKLEETIAIVEETRWSWCILLVRPSSFVIFIPIVFLLLIYMLSYWYLLNTEHCYPNRATCVGLRASPNFFEIDSFLFSLFLFLSLLCSAHPCTWFCLKSRKVISLFILFFQRNDPLVFPFKSYVWIQEQINNWYTNVISLSDSVDDVLEKLGSDQGFGIDFPRVRQNVFVLFPTNHALRPGARR